MAVARAETRRRHLRASAVWVAVEIGSGTALLLAAALAGVLFVHRPWPNRLDVAGFALLPAAPGSRLYHEIALAGALPALLTCVGCAFLVSCWRDRARAVSSVVGPAAAVSVTEWIAKPLVGRHVTALGGNSYPSGTVTAATAAALVVLLAVPLVLRVVLAPVAIGTVVAVCGAVVGMRWHYPTDALGGLLVGAGTVLLLDGLAHVPRALRARGGPRRSTVAGVADSPARRRYDAAFSRP